MAKKLTFLLIDGTMANDSVSFAKHLKRAGRKRGHIIKNLLSFLPRLKKNDPTVLHRQSKTKIYWPKLISRYKPAGSTFPFNPIRLPMRYVSLGRTGSDFVLLPHGEVKSKKNRLDDTLLETPDNPNDNEEKRRRQASDERKKQAIINGKFLKYFILAPGVLDYKTPSMARLDFATPGVNNENQYQSVDFLYLSGHGSMSGEVLGEEGFSKTFFRHMDLIRKEYHKLAGDPLSVPPRWIVIASCYSLRKIHCQIWARYLKLQRIPIRGILGYQKTSPPAKACGGINSQFGKHLGEGKTIIESWKLAHKNSRHIEAWTACAFDFSKDDTLDSLYSFKQKPIEPISKDKLYFFDNRNSGQNRTISAGAPIEITPPVALFEFHHREKDAMANEFLWKQFLISNLDFTEEKLKKYISDKRLKNEPTPFMNNKSWKKCRDKTSIIDFPDDKIDDLLNYYPFYHNEIYQFGLYPPFRRSFQNGFKQDDEIFFTLIHVRPNYTKKLAEFLKIFKVLYINGNRAAIGTNYWLEKGKGRTKIDTIKIKAPTNNSFEPVKIVVRFNPNLTKRGEYLWFWFRIIVIRGGVEVFKYDFDSFTINYEHDDIRSIAFRPIGPNDQPFPFAYLR